MTSVEPDSTRKLLNYGEDFKIPTFEYDARGHVGINSESFYTITLPGLNTKAITGADADVLGTVVTSIADPKNANIIKYNLQNFATVLLTGYSRSDVSGSGPLNATDSVNAAFSKIENHFASTDAKLADEIARAKQAEADEKTARENADSAEAAARQTKDNELAAAIATEVTDRATAISNEASARLNADNALDVRVAALETNIPTTYETKANVTALSNTVQTLQQTITSQATTIATLQGTIETLQSALTALELRVKALEDKE